LARKSPGNTVYEADVLLEKSASGIVPLKVTLVRLVQPLKALLPMLLTPLPMITLERLLQFLKLLLDKLVTLSGMVTLARLVQPLKALD
jgi:hypothetical protein